MRNRRADDRRGFARAASACGSPLRRIWEKSAHRPVDAVALLIAVAACLIIIINAVFLQSGSHPAPFFANTKTSQLADSRPQPAEPTTPAHPAAAMPAPQPVSVRRNDPIADLIGPSPRVAAVQRALSEFGYGQIKPSGILDDATSAAIEKFEREHKLPVTGRITDRLVSGLTAMVGHPIE